ncbi:MAG: lysophospholipid acyltransferase family protein [Bacteroidota bacterium]
MKFIWHRIIKLYLQIGFFFYFKKINVFGRENIPKNKGILFVAPHQNSLIDTLLIAITNNRETYFLSRAQAFKNSFIKALLSTINMLPIYRIRDGIETIPKNHDVFEQCYEILKNKKAILIFPEGNQNLQRRIRTLSKGFTRIVFGTLEKYPNNEIIIVPIGLNYSDPTSYASKVNIYYGKPFTANEYWENYDKYKSVNELKDKVSKQLKLLTTHIEDANKHDEIVKYFNRDEFLYPIKVNEKLKNLDDLSPVKPSQKKGFNLLLLIVKINSFFPFLIWKYVKPKIDEIEFIATFKYVIGITAFPIFYLIQSLIFAAIFNITIGLCYFLLSVLSVLILTKTKN